MKIKHLKVYQSVNLPGGGKNSLTTGSDQIASMELKDNVVIITLDNKTQYFCPLANVPYGILEEPSTPEKSPQKKK